MPIANIKSFAGIAQTALTKASAGVSRATERLSSGLRVNRGSDDPAGLALAAALNANTRIFNQAVLNVNDGISLVAVADGALGNLDGILVRLKELSAQAANGVFSLTQRIALDKEANALTSEYNRIIASTSFNGLNLLNGRFGTLSIQTGVGSSNTLSSTLGGELARTIGNGSFQSAVTSLSSFGAVDYTTVTDLNGDGFDDIVTALGSNVFSSLANGDGTFQSEVLLFTSPGNLAGMGVVDINNDGIEDVIFSDTDFTFTQYRLGNGNGTFQSAVTFKNEALNRFTSTDINNDGLNDVVAYSTNVFNVYLAQGDGSFGNAITFHSTGLDLREFLTADFNGDGFIDIASIDSSAQLLSINLGNGSGSFGTAITYAISSGPLSLAAGDIDHNGTIDLVIGQVGAISSFSGNGDGTFTTATSYASAGNTFARLADINGDGMVDLISAAGTSTRLYLNDGNGSFSLHSTSAMGSATIALEVGDFNGDGVIDVLNAINPSFSVTLSNTTTTTTVQRLDLTTQSAARNAQDVIDQMIERLHAARNVIGATQSRLETAQKVLSASRELTKQAASRIEDADVAEETANLVKFQVLQQTIQQAYKNINVQGDIVLQLLRP